MNKMEAIALRKSFENIGLQLLFADVGLFLGSKQHQKLSLEDRGTLSDLSDFIKSASTGLDLFSMRKQGREEMMRLDEAIQVERAFLAIKPILPDDPAQAKTTLNELNDICKKILSSEKRLNVERKKLHFCCRKFLSHLHQEFFYLTNLQSAWP